MPKKFPFRCRGRNSGGEFYTLFWAKLRGIRASNLEYISRVTAGMSGSDLKEACRDAAMVPMREYIRSRKESGI